MSPAAYQAGETGSIAHSVALRSVCLDFHFDSDATYTSALIESKKKGGIGGG